MKVNLYAVDHLQYWSGIVAELCKQQHSIYVYQPDVGTYMCEMAPSYEMDGAYATYRIKDGLEPTEEQLELLEEELMSQADLHMGTNIHFSTVEALPTFTPDNIPGDLPHAFVVEWDDDPEIESLDEVIEYLNGNPPI